MKKLQLKSIEVDEQYEKIGRKFAVVLNLLRASNYNNLFFRFNTTTKSAEA